MVRLAALYRAEVPQTITAERCPRSEGGLHDYYSEGDYWWPDPKNPDGPYIRRDGESNPENFNAHRHFMRRFSMVAAGLTAAAITLEDRSLAELAVGHLRAWFIDPATRMTPHLNFGQAIKGICTGRGIGIVDSIHLAEVAMAAIHLEVIGALQGADLDGVRGWFRDYLAWLRTSPLGIDERDHGNNHSTCWAMQVAAFALLVDDDAAIEEAIRLHQARLLPQLAADGSMPLELERTRPYNYSFFNLELFAALAQALSWKHPDVWQLTTSDGRSLRRTFDYHLPWIANPAGWPHGADISYMEHYPVRWSAPLFMGTAFGNAEALAVWQSLPPDPENEEIQRNTPIRQPMLWYPPGR